MSTAPAPLPAQPLTAAQQNAISILTKVTPYLNTSEQAIVSVAMAFSMGENPVMETFNALMGLTQAAATIPNPTIQTYAQLAGVFSGLIGSVFEGIETATTPAVITPNAKPNIFLKLFHPNIAKQEEAAAAALAAQTPVIVPPPLPK